MKVLFIAWDSPEQSYLESLFLPLFARLERRGLSIHVMQFSWGPSDAEAGAAAAARALGIRYVRESIVRRPKLLATFASVARGAIAVRRYALRHGIDVLMPRSTLPALMVLMARPGLGVRTLFDADGFMPDERVDFAGWSASGPMYRLLREVEAEMLRGADSVITRTAKGKAILLARAGAGTPPSKIFVIPNAKDSAEFQPLDPAARDVVRAELGIAPGAPLCVYVGTLGPQYLPDAMFRFVSAVLRRRSDTRFLVLTGQTEEAARVLGRSDVPAGAVTIRRLPPRAVARHLAAADLGLALREPAFSQQGVSPIKVAEYLLSGLPVLTCSGVGDLDQQLDGGLMGRFVEPANTTELDAAADWFVNDVLERREEARVCCRARGVELFGLEHATERYLDALGQPRSLAAQANRPASGSAADAPATGSPARVSID